MYKTKQVTATCNIEQSLVLQQLRCCGVLEVVRISRNGFTTKMSHQKFARRYEFLLLDHVASQDPLSVSVAILQQFNILPYMYQVGYTKLFFRTGQLAGNEVVATCGGEQKAKFLRSLGVHRVIDYKKEDIKQVLKKEYPKGVDIIYEYVGGEMFHLCLNALAPFGHLIVIGMISQYQGEHGWKPLNYTGLCEKILAKSQTVVGFFLVQYSHLWQEHLDKLFDLFSSGKLKVLYDAFEVDT